ncbi:MAG: lipid-A-disaccharide synthase [Hydrotalea sp.]|nr:lipid-A-disaccharide synthase [Hydrotalea sp.]
MKKTIAPMLKKEITIAMIAGEPSGDDLGGAVMVALRAAVQKKYPGARIKFIGVGGQKMAAAGLASLFPMEKIAKMGLAELLPHLPELIYLLCKTIRFLRAQSPDMLITIDIPDFSKRVAKALKDGPCKKIHLVAPTVWAWRAKRRFAYAKIFDELFCLYPFEARYFADTTLKTFTMGHPLVAEVARAKQAQEESSPKKSPPRVLLLAGSRRREVKHTLPLLKKFISDNRFLPATTDYVFYTQPHLVAMVKKSLQQDFVGSGAHQPQPNIKIVSDYRDKWRWFLSADLALVCMGTATLEVALAGAPMVAIYKTGWLTVFIVRRLIKVATICLPNLLAGKNIVPELIQEDLTMGNLIATAQRQFNLGRAGVRKDYDKGLRTLQTITDPAGRAAAEIVKYL